MRVADAAPEFTELLDDFAIPTKRDTPILLGIFVGEKKHLHVAPPPPPGPAVSAPPSSTPPVSVLPNAKLQELMASLNPAALQGVLAGGARSPSTAMTPPQVSNDPYPPPQRGYQPPYPNSTYQQPPSNHGYHSSYPTNDYGGYDQRGQSYQSTGYGYPPEGEPRHGGRGGEHTPNWQQGPPYHRDGNRDRDRDNGWSSRGGRRY